MLFISAYVPLFVLEAAAILRPPTTFFGFVVYVVVAFAAIVVFSSLFWRYQIWHARDASIEDYMLIGYSHEEVKSMSFIAPYISLFCLGFGNYASLLALVVFLFVIFVAYLHSDLLFVNPFLIVSGYRFYRIKARTPGLHAQDDSFSSLLISKKGRLQINNPIAIKEIDVGVVVEVENGE